MGVGVSWEKARKMQHKMSKTRSHVQSRILEITNLLAPPLGEETNKGPQAKTESASTSNPNSSIPIEAIPTMPNEPPSYKDTMSENLSSEPPPYTVSQSTSTPNLNVQSEMDNIATENTCLSKESESSHSQMIRSATTDSVGSSEHGEIIFRMESVQASTDVSSTI